LAPRADWRGLQNDNAPVVADEAAGMKSAGSEAAVW